MARIVQNSGRSSSYNPEINAVKRLEVDLDSQVITAYLGETLVFKFPCVTGDAKHTTPKGKFKIIRKERLYRSITYNAQMNYAMQITTTGIFIHESYNLTTNPVKQNFFSTGMSDTGASAMSRMRSWLPQIGKVNLNIGSVNLTGSHGCIRLGHSNAVKLFDWSDINISVEVK